MSYILDALQKSEADRHQDKLPSHLAGTKPLLFKGRGKRTFWPVAIVVLLIVNLGVLAYFVFHTETADIDRTGAESVSNLSLSSSLNALPPADGGHIDTGRDSPVINAKSEAMVVSQAEATTTRLNGVSSDSLQVARAAIAEQKQRMASANLAAEVADNAGPGVGQAAGSQFPSARTEAESDEPYLITPGQGVVTGQSSAKIEAVDMNTPPMDQADGNNGIEPSLQEPDSQEKQNDVASISDMDSSFQRTIPALTFNSHIYSSDPQGRRIMINDHYLREGQSFSGLKVEEITENGVILNKNGQSFKVSVVRNWSPN